MYIIKICLGWGLKLNELHQKSWLEKRSFILLGDRLKLYFKDMQGESESCIFYEKLKSDVQIRSHRNPKFFFITLMAISFTICILLQSILLGDGFNYAIFPCIVALVFAVLYKVKRQEYIIVETVDRQKIVFLRDKPNRKALDFFLDRLWIQRKRYLRDKYFYINYSQDIQQQTERLRWLLEQKVITKTEFKFAKDDWVIDRSYQPNRI